MGWLRDTPGDTPNSAMINAEGSRGKGAGL